MTLSLPTPAILKENPALNMLEVLRDQHADLLERYDEGHHAEALQDAADFVQQGRAFGAWIDARTDRRAAQSLLDYWSTRLYRERGDDLDATLVPFNDDLAPILPDDACPYLGLASFNEKDAGIFFGREQLIEDLLAGLQTDAILAVVGTSGSGKSSVVFAGLLTAMKQGPYPETDWHYQSGFVPGSDPQAASGKLPHPLPPQSVVVVDQFEEVFTLTPVEKRAPFAGQLLAWADAGHKVILTLRADFEARVNELPEDFGARLNVVRVLPMSAAELRKAVVKPAETVGLKFEAGLVETLVSEVSGEAAALPLLQFTLWALWQKRQRNRVLRATYDEVGGGRRALAKAADDFYNALIPEKQDAARRILLRMVKINENLEVTSQRIRRADLLSKKDGSEQRREETLDQLIQARLVRQTVGEMPADTQVEVAHEALVRNWPTLVAWLEEEHVQIRERQRLTSAAEQWRAFGRDPSALLQGILLEQALRHEDLNELEAEFIQASQDARDAAAAAAEAARQRELDQARALAEEQRHRAALEAKASRRLRRLSVALVVVSLIAVVAALDASQQRDQVTKQRDELASKYADFSKEAQQQSQAAAIQARADAAKLAGLQKTADASKGKVAPETATAQAKAVAAAQTQAAAAQAEANSLAIQAAQLQVTANAAAEFAAAQAALNAAATSAASDNATQAARAAQAATQAARPTTAANVAAQATTVLPTLAPAASSGPLGLSYEVIGIACRDAFSRNYVVTYTLTAQGGTPPYNYYRDIDLIGQGPGPLIYPFEIPKVTPGTFRVVDGTGREASGGFFTPPMSCPAPQ